MSTNTRILLILIGWLVYTLLVMQFCSKKICKTCSGVAAVTEDTSGVRDADKVAAAVNTFPLGFKWSDTEPYKGPGFDSLMNALRKGMTGDNILEITGMYYEGESVPADHETMGLARAGRIRDMFFSDLPKERVSLRSRALDETPGVQDSFFGAAAFSWVAPIRQVEELEELADRIIIRFPANSTEKEYDPKVDEYLVKLAKRVVQSGEQVQITGHTDNTGPDDINLILGQNRADQIKKILMRSGVPAAQIATASKGESQPVAPNTTAEGRHNNRRAEVRLIKKQ